MRYLLIGSLIFLTSCVTAGDLQQITDAVGDVERVLGDVESSEAEMVLALNGVRETVGDVQTRVVARTSEAIAGGTQLMEQGGLSAVITAIGLVLLNLYRSNTRQKDIAKVNHADGS